MSDTEKNYLLNNFRNFLEEEKTWLQNTLNFVGWNISDLEKLTESADPELVPCSVIPEHRIPPESILKHESGCEKRNGRYPEIADSLDFEFSEGYAVTANYFHGLLISFLFETDEKKNLLLVENFDESNITDDSKSQSEKKRKEQKESSAKYLMELLAAERDAKRRRAAHRGKRVHSNKKSYNEVLREVITNQMETLANDGDESDEPTAVAESTQKDVIQPRADCYLGVGGKCFSGNPYKRWLSIEKEERELIDEMKCTKNDKNSDKRHREDSHDRHKTYEKSSHEYKYDKKDYKYRERFKGKDYEETTKTKFKYNDRSYHSSRSKERNYSYEEKYSEKKKHDHSKRKHHHDSDSESHKSHKRQKKHKNRSRERSSYKKSHKSRHRDSESD